MWPEQHPTKLNLSKVWSTWFLGQAALGTNPEIQVYFPVRFQKPGSSRHCRKVGWLVGFPQDFTVPFKTHVLLLLHFFFPCLLVFLLKELRGHGNQGQFQEKWLRENVTSGLWTRGISICNMHCWDNQSIGKVRYKSWRNRVEELGGSALCELMEDR